MESLFITTAIISLLVTTIGILIALKIQSRVLKRTGIEHEAWQHSQEALLNLWEVKQRQDALKLEQKLTHQVQQVQAAWQRWEAREEERLAKLTLEHKLANLPQVEDVPVASNQHKHADLTNPYKPDTHPPSFYKANLSGQDLSKRYLGYVDLRQAQMVNTNFCMADLSGACLTGANLAGANLTGANLKEADLRGAILTGANMLVADLQGAILNGANLLGVRNLTTDQFNSSIFDSNTQIGAVFDVTLPRIVGAFPSDQKTTAASADSKFDTAIPFSKHIGNGLAIVESN